MSSAADAKKQKPAKGEGKRRRPRYLRFTREGRVFVLLTLGVGAAAVNTGNNLLYLVLGLLLSLIILSGVLSEIALRRVRVVRRLPQRAFAGTPCLVELEVENGKRRLSSYSIELEDVAAEPCDARCYVLKLEAGDSQVTAYRRTPIARGPLALTHVVVRTRYPFGLFEKAHRQAVDDELLVYPALAPDSHAERRAITTGPEVSVPRPGPGSEVDGVREYRAGDEARSIHWRRSAALSKTVVRDRQADAARRITLVVDDAQPAEADDAWRAGFEDVVSRAAGAATRALAAGAGVEVRTRSSASPLVLPNQPADPILRFLARLEPSAEASDRPLPESRGDVRRIEPAAAEFEPPALEGTVLHGNGVEPRGVQPPKPGAAGQSAAS